MTKKFQSITDKAAPLISVAAIVLVWLFVCEGEIVPSYMLPSPVSVVKSFIGDFTLLMSHAAVTLQEAVWGLLIGTLLGFIFAVIMDRFTFLYKALYPVLIISQIPGRERSSM